MGVALLHPSPDGDPRSRKEAYLHVRLVVLYIDPVSGSLLLQSLVAGSLGALAFWRKTILSFFSRLFGSKAKIES
jgi:hypothetical protein